MRSGGWGWRSGSVFATGIEREECDSRRSTLPIIVLTQESEEGSRFPVGGGVVRYVRWAGRHSSPPWAGSASSLTPRLPALPTLPESWSAGLGAETELSAEGGRRGRAKGAELSGALSWKSERGRAAPAGRRPWRTREEAGDQRQPWLGRYIHLDKLSPTKPRSSFLSC